MIQTFEQLTVELDGPGGAVGVVQSPRLTLLLEHLCLKIWKFKHFNMETVSLRGG
jgi:hypothetical protein